MLSLIIQNAVTVKTHNFAVKSVVLIQINLPLIYFKLSQTSKHVSVL